MTRKDYILIAAAINDAYHSASFVNEEITRVAVLHGIDCAANYLAAALGRDNPRFDRSRFVKACGL